uniref:Paired amphipathic helix protein Sin3-like 4 isoform X3 n=1 Tax=Rhizophora mucronata TaxID=61149 RepID=A0A2P2PPJ6_RHIMU
MEKLVWRLYKKQSIVLSRGNFKQCREKEHVERQEEKMMLMTKVKKVLKGHQKSVSMPLRMVVMFLKVSQLMVKTAPGKNMKKM